MQIPGPCDLCDRHSVLRTCSLCGQKVCQDHYDVSAGTCTQCAQRARKGEPRAPEPRNIPPTPEGDIPPEGTGRYT